MRLGARRPDVGLGSNRLRGSKDDEKEWTKDSMPQNSQGLGTARLRT